MRRALRRLRQLVPAVVPLALALWAAPEHSMAAERIVGMGCRFGYGQSVDGGRDLANCVTELTNYRATTRSTMRLFRRNDQGQGGRACWSGSVQGTTSPRQIVELDIVYELDAQNPLEMLAGVYTGAITYSIGGAGQEIDLGDNIELDSSVSSLNFSLTVNQYHPGPQRGGLPVDHHHGQAAVRPAGLCV